MTGTQGVRRVLAIDGGGLKGALPAALLAEIEERSGRRIVDQFDLIAGTSTGGIIALGLAMGLSAKEILAFYRTRGPSIFRQSAEPEGTLSARVRAGVSRLARAARSLFLSKYGSEGLREALSSVFAERLLGEAQTRLVIPAYDSMVGGPYVFKTAHHPRFKADHVRRVVDVALCTAAAPTYLPAHSFEGGASIVDGGVWANNPAGAAALEAAAILQWDMTSVRLLSLGCSQSYLAPKPNVGKIGAARGLWVTNLLMEGQACFSMATAKLLLGHPHTNPHLIRIDPQVPPGFASLDDARKIDELARLGVAAARQHLPEIERCFLIGKREPFVPKYETRRRAA